MRVDLPGISVSPTTLAAFPMMLHAPAGTQSSHACPSSAAPGRNPGIPWADRFAYCQAGSNLEPGTLLVGRCVQA